MWKCAVSRTGRVQASRGQNERKHLLQMNREEIIYEAVSTGLCVCVCVYCSNTITLSLLIVYQACWNHQANICTHTHTHVHILAHRHTPLLLPVFVSQVIVMHYIASVGCLALCVCVCS